MPDWTPTAISTEQTQVPAAPSPLVHAAERLTERIRKLDGEVAQLRLENAALRREVREAVGLLERAAAGAPERPRRGRRPAGDAPRRRRRGRTPKGRATPSSVTGDVVKAVLAKLGSATASEIAGEITKAGAPVSGRAVRFLAERAGAHTFVADDGQRRYRL